MGGSISLAFGELGGSFQEPPLGCLMPRWERVLYPDLLGGFRSAGGRGPDLGAGLEGGARGRTVSSPRRGGASGDQESLG